MFKKIEMVWNARTPVYLHNGTKQNVIFQLALAGAIVAAMYAWDAGVKERRQTRKNAMDENTYYLSDYAEQR